MFWAKDFFSQIPNAACRMCHKIMSRLQLRKLITALICDHCQFFSRVGTSLYAHVVRPVEILQFGL